MWGKQRCRCFTCVYNYTGGTTAAYLDEKQQLALKLYLEGMGSCAIGQRAQQQAADALG